MPKIPRPPLTLVPDHRDGWFYNSDVGERLAIERSESEETIRMRRWDALRMICRSRIMVVLGMPKLTSYQFDILRLILVCGRLVDERWTWAALRGHTSYLNVAIAHEIGVDRHDVSRALPLLREHNVVEIGEAYGTEPAIMLAEGFHRFCFEAQWRETLRNSDTPLTDQLVRKNGWKWLLEKLDDAFRKRGANPANRQSRTTVLASVLTPYIQ